MSITAVIFDLDGVIIDTEEIWSVARHDFAVAHGGHWTPEVDQPKVMGANSMEWAESMRDNNGVDLSADVIYRGVVDDLRARYAQHLPIIAGAREAVVRLAHTYDLGVASSSPLELIEHALELSGLCAHFRMLISSDDVAVGKPQPDVYIEACRRLGSSPARAVAVEDSSNGIRAAHGAGLAVIAVPQPAFPPGSEALALADLVLDTIDELTSWAVEEADRRRLARR